MTNKDLIKELLDLSQRFNYTITNIEKSFAVQSEILRQINDQNILHKQAIDINTMATKDLSSFVREQTKSFNKMWYIFWIVILALIVLAGAERALHWISVIKI